MSKRTLFAAMSALFLVLFIDGMGQAIMYPILTKTLLDPKTQVFMLHSSVEFRDVIYALTIGIFFLGWFIGGVYLSDLSDSIGRKKALMICIAGSAVGYFFCALAFIFHNVFWLILGRAIDGFTAGDQPIAQATVLDLCPKEKKNVYIGMVLFSFTLGMILGPIIGAFFSQGHAFFKLTNASPMYLGMWLSVIAFVVMGVFLKDSNTVYRKVVPRLSRVFYIFKEAFQDQKVSKLLYCFLLMQCGWSMYFLYSSVFLNKVFDFGPHKVAYFIMLIGIGLTIGLTVLPRLFGKVKNQRSVVVVGFLVVGVSALIASFKPSVPLMWLLSLPAPAMFAVAYTSLMPIFSNSVSEDRQGWVMGLTGSVVALTAGVGPLISGFVNAYGNTLPMLAAAIITFVGCALMLRVKA